MKTHFCISKKVDGRKMSQLLVRFVASKKDIYRGKTGIYIKPGNWDAKNNVPKTSKRDQEDIAECRRVQRHMDSLSSIIMENYIRDKEHGEDWLTNLLSRLKWNDDGNPVSVSNTEFSAMCISESYGLMVQTGLDNNEFGITTASVYRTMQRKMREYEEEYGEVKVREFEIEPFMRFLRCKRLSENTLNEYRSKTMRWWHWCQERDPSLPNISRSDGKVHAKVYGTPYYLTREQRDALYRAEIKSSATRLVRDAFVFQCLVGCRVSDLLSLTESNIKDGCLVYIAKKTLHSNPQTISVPLHPIALEIIDRYKGDGILFKLPSDHHWRDEHLRKAIRLSGIDCLITIRDCHTGEPRQVMLSEKASSHMARRTFIGCLYENGFRESDICSMSGHKEGSLSIQRYRRVSDERKRLMIDSI